ncbi:MAG: aminopeptidase N [Alphaproteobacteria bacterium]|nr:aminopeptidase N [Alphaproteobacteria bacterium]
MTSSTPKTIRRDAYRAPAYSIDTVTLAVDLGEEATRVRSRLSIRRGQDDGDDAPLVLDGEGLVLVSITLDGTLLAEDAYALSDTSMTVFTPPERFTLETEAVIHPETNTALEGLYKSSGNFCTQCEAEGFRRITWYLDRPDVMAVFDTRITADKTLYPVLLSNGNKTGGGDLDDGRHFAEWHDPYPKPSYLFALVAGKLGCVADTFTTASGRTVALHIYVEPGKEDRCGHAMDSLKKAMRWDEEVFGLEYDLDIYMIVAVSDFNMGAMENKGLNVFNDKYILADPETATDTDYANIEAIIAHEYFHNWTGNRVTCRDWFQLSLKEGLTVFRDQQFSADMRSAAVERIHQVRALRARQFPEDAGPLAHPVRPDSYIEINNFYTATVYEKGAEVIRMMHTLLGKDGFRRGMDLYFERHDGQAVTCEDFVTAMEDATGADLRQFRRWYSQAGTPKVAVTGSYDATAKTFEMAITQRSAPTPGQPAKEPLHVPISVGLFGDTGAALPLRLDGGDGNAAGTTALLNLTKTKQVFRFRDLPAKPVPSVLRGFSAPVRLSLDLTAEARRRLIGADSDEFNRWESAQQYAATLLLKMVSAEQAGDAVPTDDAFIEALGNTLRDTALDNAVTAEILSLPGESYLAQQMAVVDVDGIHAAREALRRAIAVALKDDFLAAYHGNASNRPYTPDAADAGQRRLRNTALAYLCTLDDPAMLALCTEQAETADNMTDRMGALDILKDIEDPVGQTALDAFYARWQNDSLVVDKWLSLQAMSTRPDTLQTVTGLLEHDAFSMKTPNKVRALIGAFCSGNQLRFNAADGGGYRFLTDRVLALDPINPQVAARLVGAFGQWRRFDEDRQRLMREALKRIVSTEGLSPDVYEIASKTLA